jgi:hypothetical protein
MRMTGARVIEIADCRSNGRIITYLGRKVFNSCQSLAPQTFHRQRLYLSTDVSSMPATGVDCLRQAAHACLLVSVSKLHVGKEPQ